MITKAETQSILKQFAELDAQDQQIEFKRARLAHDLRAKFVAGSAGDTQFFAWFEKEAPHYDHSIRLRMLERAKAFKISSDPEVWQKPGGEKQLRNLITRPAKEAAIIVKEAQATGRSIASVVKERDPKPAAPPPSPVRPPAGPDADIVAQYVRALSARVLASLVAVPLTKASHVPKAVLDAARRIASKKGMPAVAAPEYRARKSEQPRA